MDLNYLEVLKTGSQLLRARKTVLQLFGDIKKWFPTVWSPKNVVHDSLEQAKSG